MKIKTNDIFHSKVRKIYLKEVLLDLMKEMMMKLKQILKREFKMKKWKLNKELEILKMAKLNLNIKIELLMKLTNFDKNRLNFRISKI